MYQAPTAIWNEIAETQPVKHQPWKRLFPLSSDRLLTELETIEKQLEREGADARVIRGYLLTAPLLMETVAISRYLAESESINLRSSLPELTSIREAVDLATQEFRLNRPQQVKLRDLLTKAHQSSASGPNNARQTV